MIWAVYVLLFSINSLETWEFFGDKLNYLTDEWQVIRTDHVSKVKEKFPTELEMECQDLYKTDKAPFTALILYKTSGRYLCMGAVVDKRHILSARKCFEKTDVTDLLVLVGYYKAYWGKNSQVMDVEKIIRNDYAIALLRLTDRLTYTDYVKATKLPTAFTKMERDFAKTWPPPYQVVGMNVDRFDVPGEYIDKEKVYSIKEDNIVDFGQCKANFSKEVLDETKLFCVMGNATYCWGGWGGPVLKWMPNSYFLQVGVVICDNCTADTMGPFLCARTDVFGDWIRGNTWQGRQPA